MTEGDGDSNQGSQADGALTPRGEVWQRDLPADLFCGHGWTARGATIRGDSATKSSNTPP